jgi:hypothetical protein
MKTLTKFTHRNGRCTESQKKPRACQGSQSTNHARRGSRKRPDPPCGFSDGPAPRSAFKPRCPAGFSFFKPSFLKEPATAMTVSFAAVPGASFH